MIAALVFLQVYPPSDASLDPDYSVSAFNKFLSSSASSYLLAVSLIISIFTSEPVIIFTPLSRDTMYIVH